MLVSQEASEDREQICFILLAAGSNESCRCLVCVIIHFSFRMRQIYYRFAKVLQKENVEKMKCIIVASPRHHLNQKVIFFYVTLINI